MSKPTLADKLKSLGVKVGTSEITPPAAKPAGTDSLESALESHWVDTLRGRTLVHEEHYPLEYRHGIAPLFAPAPLHNLANWAGDARQCDMPVGNWLFRYETSGSPAALGRTPSWWELGASRKPTLVRISTSPNSSCATRRKSRRF
jgi:hypothetical protein